MGVNFKDTKLVFLYLNILLFSIGVSLSYAAPQSVLSEVQNETVRRLNNILVIVADDLGIEQLSLYGIGSDYMPTPNIDRLAQDGVLFRNFWVNPVCCPTRSTLMTGRYSFRTGIGVVLDPYAPPGTYDLPLSEITIPEMLDAGAQGQYTHAAIGKWHLGYSLTHANDSGFNYFSGTNWNLGDNGGTYYIFDKVVNGQVVPNTDYATTEQVNDALDWIQNNPQPWFVYLSFNAPHVPYSIPPQNLHSYNLSTCQGVANKRPCFKAMVEAMDTEIGRLLDNIPPKVLRNTTVIFLGDNGSNDTIIPPPLDQTHSKGSLFDGGINVPFIVKSPLIRQPGSISNALVNSTDLFATVADIAQINLADPNVIPTGVELDSVSIVPYLRQPARPSIRTTIFAEKFSPNGPLTGLPVAPSPVPVCQSAIGMQGPGNTQLQICGDVLAWGGKADIILSGAPANSVVEIIATDTLNLISMHGGQLIGWPPDYSYSYTTDANGNLTVSDIVKSSDKFSYTSELYYQAIVQNPLQPQGYDVSNAVELTHPNLNIKAIRNACFKLIDSVNSNPPYREMYNLCADPLETANIYPPAPGSAQELEYNMLKTELDNLLQ